jgi:high-affinity iron transporter
VASPQWTGCYRLEYGLWHGQPPSELKPVAHKLTSGVKGAARRLVACVTRRVT